MAAMSENLETTMTITFSMAENPRIAKSARFHFHWFAHSKASKVRLYLSGSLFIVYGRSKLILSIDSAGSKTSLNKSSSQYLDSELGK